MHPVKSFRIYFREPIKTPSREVSDYSPEEQLLFQKSFAPIATRYRRHLRIAIFGIIGFGVFLTVALLLQKTRFSSIAPFFVVACWLLTIGALVSAPRLACPGCSHSMADGLGPYCPECGNRTVEPRRFMVSARCSSCRRLLIRRKGHRYKIRACTCCGLMLDEAGL